MSRCAIRFLMLLLALVSVYAFAQEGRVVQVCVPAPRNVSTRSVPGNLERDRLVSDLNQQKPDKKTHVMVRGVPVDGTSADEIGDQIKQKKCDYVVYTTITEVRLSSDPVGMPRPGTIQTNPNIGVGMPGSSPSSQNQSYQATVEYKLTRVDGAAVSGAPFSSSQGVTEDAAVSQVMDRIASRVASDVKKGGAPPMQE
ncbi:MAG TPA: hypothetical protein VMT89_07735 [Candidatus Acidoferrales bacterium]|nr:hypothetical protein [Candidatus Acidoferrales bacterium]